MCHTCGVHKKVRLVIFDRRGFFFDIMCKSQSSKFGENDFEYKMPLEQTNLTFLLQKETLFNLTFI